MDSRGSRKGPEECARLGSSPSHWGLLSTVGGGGQRCRSGAQSGALALRRRVGVGRGRRVLGKGRTVTGRANSRETEQLCPGSNHPFVQLLRRRKQWPDVLSSELVTLWAARVMGTAIQPLEIPHGGWRGEGREGRPVLELSSGPRPRTSFSFSFSLRRNSYSVRYKTLTWRFYPCTPLCSHHPVQNLELSQDPRRLPQALSQPRPPKYPSSP